MQLLLLLNPTEGATLYVTLEPCCHYGRRRRVRKRFRAEDKSSDWIQTPSEVAGEGAKILRDAGVTVVEDFIETNVMN